ncbi:hypothetical protein [Paenibacillus sp. IHBB 3054]|uniref:hypothetical protein n=1 Tax=Paenibacillus sp. IHBB 3054 TaxID=3425689 RepID=UPI003F67E9D6
MLLYLTSNNKSGLIDAAVNEKELTAKTQKAGGQILPVQFCHQGYAQLCNGKVFRGGLLLYGRAA